MVKDFATGAREGARAFADLVADSINLLLLFLVYFVGVGLVSIVAKLTGKHFLDFGKGGRETYWTRIIKQPQKDDFYRMF